MCYRNPHEYFQKKEISKFSFVFANLTKELALGVAYREFNDTLRSSPYFQEHGKFSKSDRNFYYVPEGDKIEIIGVSDSAQALGRQVFFSFIDECNFAKSGVKDINKAKASMKALYDTINARISGTFRIGGEVYGKLVTGSSKNTDSDFLSSHIENQLNSGNTHLYLVDEPQWKILPKSMFSDDRFYFTVGDNVKIEIIDEKNKKAVIEEICERQVYIKRPKLANISQIIFVVSSKDPKPDLLMLDKQIAFAEFIGVKIVIVLNKTDLDKKHEFENIKQTYENIGYKVILTNAKSGEGINELKIELKNNINAFSGNSGVRKININKFNF